MEGFRTQKDEKESKQRKNSVSLARYCSSERRDVNIGLSNRHLLSKETKSRDEKMYKVNKITP